MCKHYEMFSHQSRLYIVMEYCERGDLSEYLSQSVEINETKIIKIVLQVL